jgi:dihydrofolate reductase
MSFSAITHCDTTGLIGLNNQLAYHSSEDLKEFKAQTLGNQTILVMGKNTYQECGNLPERIILALSSKGNLLNGKATNETVETLSKSNYMIICGGSIVYEQFLPLCESVIVHFTKQPNKKPGTNPRYFPLQLLNELFRPTTVKDFKTFTQIWYFNKYENSFY